MLQISVNGKALSFQTKQFSGGEEHIVLEDITNNMENQHIKIHALIRSSSKLMQLLLLVDAIKRRFSNIVAFELELPYIPYARQDRQCNLGEAFSLKVDRKSTRLNSSHVRISYAVFCLKKKKNKNNHI